MTDTIYEKHDAAFAHVQAAVIVDPKTCERVATIAFKRAASGLRVTCYLHVLGIQMQAGRADGGGYDKHTAAASAAAARLKCEDEPEYPTSENVRATVAAIKQALRHDDGTDWSRCIVNAGFKVFGAV